MVVLVLRTVVNAISMDDYRQWERLCFLPIFQRSSGCTGVLFLRGSAGDCWILAFWKDSQSVNTLQSSEVYQQIMQESATMTLESETWILETVTEFFSTG